ncbi:MAG TPA: DUF2892 domain-containing protein [Candidatus Manganitrophaceae bacterium]|nr:DUF2892 domain-containing protein [Candidatus Manganitrophaceae bacterium]
MKCNVGGVERGVRIAVGVILFSIGYFGMLPTWGAVTTYLVGVIILMTGIFGYCPVYQFFELNTCEPPMKQKHSR